ncbi:MFS transporter [Agrobacterium leguminum]|uniref:MFS transporter n=1 Tax=Rhizobiaceae TaxID=82115 RepID=UPI001490373B|nr:MULTISPECIES: MFS transporter [Rhizobiaceae]MCZ7934787.1 MFS transporter [Agrobacterium leguminum]MCZ7977262.1 MFS transporter [Agrobacterium salinitolerans]NOV19262.1 MFS transporter [Ensifer canadensis]NSX94079.1 MFS transporter [Agrobacterium tumefaciens]NTA40612.1 MFS transporter [Agrobacterium salinitolerans]
MTSAQMPYVTGVREQIATRLTFLIAGLGMAAWAPLVPYAKDRVGADNATLGLLLLSLGLGSIIAMPATGVLASRFGCRAVIITATCLLSIMVPVLAFVDTQPQLAIALAIFGASVGTVDVAVNIQAVMVEKDSGRSMMSGFHGLFSLGGIIGAGGVSFALGSGVPLPAVTYMVGGVLMVLLMLAHAGLLRYGDTEQGITPLFVAPKGVVMVLGLLCFLVFMGEGAILDWSALFLVNNHGYEQASAGIAYTSFAVTMTIGRLLGDRVVARLGGTRTVVFGGLLAASGFALAVSATDATLVLVGFGLVGMGLSNIAPVFFTAAGRQTVMPASLAVAAVFTFGYAGILLGPAMIGFVGQIRSLGFAFLLLSAAMCLVAVVGPMAARGK